jgi:hypothetical protein
MPRRVLVPWRSLNTSDLQARLARSSSVRGIDMTKLQRLTILLTICNLILLVFGLAQLRPAIAQDVAPISRSCIGNRG